MMSRLRYGLAATLAKAGYKRAAFTYLLPRCNHRDLDVAATAMQSLLELKYARSPEALRNLLLSEMATHEHFKIARFFLNAPRHVNLRRPWEMYSCTDGSAPTHEHIQSASCILVGEQHNDEAHFVYNAALLRRYAKPIDVLLIEGWPAGEGDAKNKNDLPFAQHLTVLGWDNRQNLVQQTQLREEIVALANGPSIDQDPILSKRWDDTIAAFQQVSSKRNESMARAIEDAQLTFPGAKVFVIAGADHVTASSNIWDLVDSSHLGLIARESTSLQLRNGFVDVFQAATNVEGEKNHP